MSYLFFSLCTIRTEPAGGRDHDRGAEPCERLPGYRTGLCGPASRQERRGHGGLQVTWAAVWFVVVVVCRQYGVSPSLAVGLHAHAPHTHPCLPQLPYTPFFRALASPAARGDIIHLVHQANCFFITSQQAQRDEVHPGHENTKNNIFPQNRAAENDRIVVF